MMRVLSGTYDLLVELLNLRIVAEAEICHGAERRGKHRQMLETAGRSRTLMEWNPCATACLVV
jgi:hypothetical protein